MALVKAGTPFNLTISDHKELDRGLLRGLIRDAGLTVEEFVALLAGWAEALCHPSSPPSDG
jgi:hypothetical protein